MTAAVCSSQRAEQRLAIYRKLFSLLEDVFPTQTEDTRALLGQCWCVLAGRFTNFLKEVEGVTCTCHSKLCFDCFHRLVLSMKEASANLTSPWYWRFWNFRFNMQFPGWIADFYNSTLEPRGGHKNDRVCYYRHHNNTHTLGIACWIRKFTHTVPSQVCWQLPSLIIPF